MRRKSIPFRIVNEAARRWGRLRRRVGRANKARWVFVSLLVSILLASGYALRAMVEHQDEQRSLTCLALNVYHEARGEPEAGQYAVAEVTMNRVASRHYPNTICGVVYQRNWDVLRKRYVSAFSWTEFDTVPSPRDREWRDAQRIANDVYVGRYDAQLNGALFYHSKYIKPSWARGKLPVARIGRHVFYN